MFSSFVLVGFSLAFEIFFPPSILSLEASHFFLMLCYKIFGQLLVLLFDQLLIIHFDSLNGCFELSDAVGVVSSLVG
jgi:hypothetical protein